MKGYKGFNNDLSCLSLQYEVGNIYEMIDEPMICHKGYHFCEKLEDVFEYYSFFNPDNKKHNRFCEVEALGNIVTKNSKSCTNKIKIVRELSEKDICEILNIDYDLFMKYKKDFNDTRINQILYGLMECLDISIYAKSEINWKQMREIRWGLLDDLDVSVYAKPEFNVYQMEQIRYGLKNNLDISLYAKPEFDQYQMSEIRYGLEEGLDISVYAKPEFNDDQMSEIRYGLEEGLDISIYAKSEINWKQMREIRYSLKGEKC